MDYQKIARNLFEDMEDHELIHFFGNSTSPEVRREYLSQIGIKELDRTDLYNIYHKLMDIIQYEEPDLFVKL